MDALELEFEPKEHTWYLMDGMKEYDGQFPFLITPIVKEGVTSPEFFGKLVTKGFGTQSTGGVNVIEVEGKYGTYYYEIANTYIRQIEKPEGAPDDTPVLANKIGKEVIFEGSDDVWLVLYDEEEKTTGAQLIKAGEPLELNENRVSYWSNQNPDINGDESISRRDINIFIYNNFIEIANDLQEDAVKNLFGGSLPNTIVDVRAVGTNPTNKNAEPSTKYNLPSGWLSGDEFEVVKENYLKSADTNYEADLNRLNELGTFIEEVMSGYFTLASRRIVEDLSNDRVYFMINQFDDDAENHLDGVDEFTISNTSVSVGPDTTWDEIYDSIPVITLDSGVLSNVTVDQYGVYTISNS